MTIIATAFNRVLALFGLVCAVIVALFVFSAYNGGDQIAKVACAVQTNGVAEYSTCMYNAGADIND